MDNEKAPRWTPEQTVETVEAYWRLLAEPVVERLDKDERLHAHGGAACVKQRLGDLAPAIEHKQQEVVAYIPPASGEPDPAVLAEARDRVSAVREAVKRTHRDNSRLRAAFGVGAVVDWEDPASVRFALGQILVGASEHPESARQAQIKPTDLEPIAALEAKLHPAPVSPGRPENPAVAARNKLQLEAEQLVDAVIAGVALSFATEPDVLRSFKGALPSRRPTPPPSPAPTTETGDVDEDPGAE